jgi:hypothetical protein
MGRARSVAPRNSNEDGYGARGKIPSHYNNQAAQMGRLGAPAMRLIGAGGTLVLPLGSRVSDCSGLSQVKLGKKGSRNQDLLR